MIKTILASLALVLVLIAAAEAAGPRLTETYCAAIRAAVAQFGRNAVENRARAAGFTWIQIRQGRACLSTRAAKN